MFGISAGTALAIGVTGGAVLSSMGSGGPDTSKADANAAQINQLSQDQFDWVKKQYEDSAPDRKIASDKANAISDAQLAEMKQATAQEQDYAQYNQGVFRPLEQKIVADAQGYDTEARREQAAGKASADVQQAYGAAAADSGRDMARMGVNPSDGAYGAMESDRQIQQALGIAGAENRARTQVETIGAAKMADAASLGRGLPSAQATQASLALTAGNDAATTGNMPNQINQSGVNMVNGGYSNAIQGLGTAGNIYEQSARTQAQDSGIWGALGTIGGAAIAKKW